MLSARAVVRTSLPLLGLAALALQSALQSAPGPTTLVSEGRGSVASLDAGRVVTDGRPVVVSLPVRRVAAPVVAAPSTVTVPSARRPVARAFAASPRSQPPVVRQAKPAQVRDTYPWASDTTWAPDPWGFTKRQCVSYVAWRLAGAGRPLDNATQHWNSALDWDDTARRLGYRVSTRPSVGAVAHWNANEASRYWSPGASSADGRYVAGHAGHVAWVLRVYDDGSVLVAQYNGMGDRAFSTMHVTAPRFLSL